MFYAYLLKSINHPQQNYVGFSKNPKTRLNDHNEGLSPHTKKYKPWKLETYVAFLDEQKARDFEKYLKSGSGTAFRKKRLL